MKNQGAADSNSAEGRCSALEYRGLRQGLRVPSGSDIEHENQGSRWVPDGPKNDDDELCESREGMNN